MNKSTLPRERWRGLTRSSAQRRLQPVRLQDLAVAASVLEPPVAPTPNRLLVVGTIHDPATPYAGAVALTKILGNATLLTWDGNNHTAMAYSTCIADAAAHYLIDLTLPPDGTHCPP